MGMRCGGSRVRLWVMANRGSSHSCSFQTWLFWAMPRQRLQQGLYFSRDNLNKKTSGLTQHPFLQQQLEDRLSALLRADVC
jgi:hypothetical protein